MKCVGWVVVLSELCDAVSLGELFLPRESRRLHLLWHVDGTQNVRVVALAYPAQVRHGSADYHIQSPERRQSDDVLFTKRTFDF